MKNTNRQTLPLGRSTKEENAGLSLLRPRLIEIIGDNYVYFNEILQNICTSIVNVISKPISPFIARLKSFKFIDNPTYHCAFSYNHPHAHAAIYYFLTGGDRWFYDYRGIEY